MNDFRFALRIWRKQPFLMAAAILAATVAIGATVAVFSVVNAVLIKPLPYANQKELAVIWDNFLRLHMENLPAAPAETADYARLNRVFADVSTFSYTEFNLLLHGQSMRALGTRVSANLFSLLEAHALLGRTLLPADGRTTSPAVAVMSYGLWRRTAPGDASIVGQTITINSKSYAVVGVMPPEFEFPIQGVRFPANSDLWVPAQLSPQELADRDAHEWFTLARLKPGISLADAQTNMDDIAGLLDRMYPN